RRRRRDTSPPSWSSARRVMASTAPMMDCSASGGTPPGSTVTSGLAASACWVKPNTRTVDAIARRIDEKLVPGRDGRHLGGKIARQRRYLQGHLVRDVVVQAGDRPFGVGHHGGLARIGLQADVHGQRQGAQPGQMVFGRHVAAPVLAEYRLGMAAVGA